MQSIESMSFEESLKELETIVRRLEEGKINLEDAMNAYERGAGLKAHCEKKLKEARLRVEQIVVGEDGSVTLQKSELGE